jgi:signal transduction histidine kinase
MFTTLVDLSFSSIELLLIIILLLLSAFCVWYSWLMRKRERADCNQLLEKKELEKKIGILQAKQEERSRISADLHDDLGAGLTSIRLYSELAVERPGSGSMPEVHKISSLAHDLINSMNAIIWTMEVANDSLSNLMLYLKKVAHDYFDGTNINLQVNATENAPELEVSGEKRRNIYLVVKEILANIVKHSRATEVTMNVFYSTQLIIMIKDNGSGFSEQQNKRQGHGLKNMQRRIQELNGKFEISHADGTKVEIEIPL